MIAAMRADRMPRVFVKTRYGSSAAAMMALALGPRGQIAAYTTAALGADALLAGRLRADKLRDLQAGGASRIATANIGCLLHLRAATTTPVLHWLNLLAEK